MYRNNLTREYANHQNNNVAFAQNPILANNSHFNNYTKDPNYINRINAAKAEQERKIKSVKDLNMDQKELTKCVINPIIIDKNTDEDIRNLKIECDTKAETYVALQKYSADKKNMVLAKVIPKEILDLWDKRTNNPYKRVLHNLGIDEYTKKQYNNQNDLVYFKTTAKTKKSENQKKADIERLEREMKTTWSLIQQHDVELETLFPKTENAIKKHGEKFEYANVYKNRLKYDPKNCAELKEIYKKEQKKVCNDVKRIDNLVNMLFAKDDLTKEEYEEYEKLQREELAAASKSSNQNSNFIGTKESLIKEFGEDVYNQMAEEFGLETNKNNIDIKNNIVEKKKRPIIVEDVDVVVEKKKRAIIVEEETTVVAAVPVTEQKKSFVSQALIDKYKNKQKK